LVVKTNWVGIESEVVTSTGLCPVTVGKFSMTYTGETTVKPASGEIWVE
jgi:hypothetical protein